MSKVENYYVMFRALQKHFTTKYDYFKYSGNCKVSKTYMKNNELTCFALMKRYDIESYKWLCISNLIKNPNIWLNNLLESGSEENYHNKIKDLSALSYNFKNDMHNIIQAGDFNSMLSPKSEELPVVYRMTRKGEIKLETLIILHKLLNIFQIWSKYYDDIVLCESLKIWTKYEKFVDIKKQSMYKDVIINMCSVDKFNNNKRG